MFAVANFTAKAPIRVQARKASVQSKRIVSLKAQETEINVEKAIQEATETCADDEKAAECATAWDEVEELSAAAADKNQKKAESDPLEEYCKDAPEADECRVYED